MIFHSNITHFRIDYYIKGPYFRQQKHLSKVIGVYNFSLISKDFLISHQNIGIEIYP